MNTPTLDIRIVRKDGTSERLYVTASQYMKLLTSGELSSIQIVK